jgi:hypothetical protein
VLLPADESLALREKLICELKGFTSTDALTIWAQRTLSLKNQFTTSDAQEVESAFAAKLIELGDDVVSLVKPEVIAIAEVAGDGEQTTANGNSTFDREPVPKSEKPKSGRRLNGSRVPRRVATSEKGSAEDVPTETAQQLVTPLGKELRLRDRDHLKFVSTQPCLACGRSPSDAHHLKFAQQRALGRKVSDEFTVPLCRTHHRELHQRGDELKWWHQMDINPLDTAQQLWRHSQLTGAPAPTGVTVAAVSG